jgi:hypothetical protein
MLREEKVLIYKPGQASLHVFPTGFSIDGGIAN